MVIRDEALVLPSYEEQKQRFIAHINAQSWSEPVQQFITPFMVYAANDNVAACHELILAGLEEVEIANIIYGTKGQYSTLTLAAIPCGAKQVVDFLLTLKIYPQEHLEEAVLVAAEHNQLEIIKLFHARGVYLFRNGGPDGLTALHKACMKGYKAIVEFLVTVASSDLELSKPCTNLYNNLSAYDLALHYDKACAEVLKKTGAGSYSRKTTAIDEKDTDKLLALIKHDEQAYNPFVGDYYHRSQTVIDKVALFTSMHDCYRTMFDKLYDLLNEYPVSIRINTLLLSLGEITLLLNGAKEQAQKDYLQTVVMKLFADLEELSKQVEVLPKLSINGMRLRGPNDFNAVGKLSAIAYAIIERAKPANLDFAYMSKIIFDPIQNCSPYINLNPDAIPFVVSALLDNTNLISNGLMTITRDQIYGKLLDVVVERNRYIKEQTSPMVCDYIYNRYVPKINELIAEIKKNAALKNTHVLEPLELIKQVYSLKDISARYIAKTKDNNRFDVSILPQELKEEVEQAKLPLGLMQFGKTYKSTPVTLEAENEMALRLRRGWWVR